MEIVAARVIRKSKIEEVVRSFGLRIDETIWKAIVVNKEMQNAFTIVS